MRSGQNGGNRLFVVLKIPQVFIAQLAVVGRYPMAVVRIVAGLDLVDKIAYSQGVRLGSTKNQSFFLPVDFRHEDFNPFLFTLFDFDNLVEIIFAIYLACFNLTFNQSVIGSIDVFVQSCGNLLHPKRC